MPVPESQFQLIVINLKKAKKQNDENLSWHDIKNRDGDIVGTCTQKLPDTTNKEIKREKPPEGWKMSAVKQIYKKMDSKECYINYYSVDGLH